MTDPFPLPSSKPDKDLHEGWFATCPALDGRLFPVRTPAKVYMHEAEHLIWRVLRLEGIDPAGLRVFPVRGADDRGELP